MKIILLTILMLGSISAFAQVPKTFSVMGGVAAISSEVGYTFGIFSPSCVTNDISVFLQFSQYFTQSSNSYSMITFGSINRIVDILDFSVYFKSAALLMFEPQTNIGLNFAGGTEYKLKEDFLAGLTVFIEIGYSFPFIVHTYAQGIALNLGLKLYF